MNLHKNTSNSVLPWTITGLLIAVLGGIIFVSSGYGYKGDMWHLYTAMRFFAVGAAVAGLGLVVCGAGLLISRGNYNRRNLSAAIGGIIIGITVVSTFLYFFAASRIDPPIHDITTDTNDPPKFDVVSTLRNKNSNPCTYGGMAVAEQQEEAYPYVKPLLLDMSFENAFHNALIVARSMKRWKIVNSNATAGKIEATVTSSWFGLKEDIVVRISAIDPSRSKIDVRSESRIGVNDLGTNARRIHNYLALVKKESFDRN